MMMTNLKYLLSALFIVGFSVFSFAQTENNKVNPLSKKGQVFAFWGWNFAAYSNSDIRFKGNGYDFMLHDVVARDRQTPFKFGTYF
ncbi:MAG: hypothetical protein Q4G16_01960, partial [Cruoricaptor ignavus]|nr:hypothetical protein [Cruoricaptor ignavus]